MNLREEEGVRGCETEHKCRDGDCHDSKEKGDLLACPYDFRRLPRRS
jgi:hypothetical protein